MSEGNHSAEGKSLNSRNRSRTWTLIVGGIAVAILAGGVLFQFTRSQSTAQGFEAPNDDGPADAGTARVSRRGDSRQMALVNGQLISREDLASECLSRYGKEVLDSMIDRKIVDLACQERNIEVSTAEIDGEVLKIAQKFNLTPDNWYHMLEAERKITPDQYRRNVIWPMIALRKIAGETIEITENDLKRAYIRDYGEKVKSKMIMLDNMRRAKEVWQKAHDNPKNFGQFAREHSVEPNSRALDGSIPPIQRYAGNDTLEEAAFNLKAGEVSGIIQVGTGQQYVILLCEGRTECKVQFEEVKQSLHEQIMEEKIQVQVANIFNKLKQQAVVHNFLTNESTGGVQKASATSTGKERVTPALDTRPTRQSSKQRPRQPVRQTDEN